MNENSYPYNDDLLTSINDQNQATMEYGSVAFALIFPELIQLVQEADVVANKEKLHLRKRGLFSIALVTLALLAASAAPLYYQLPRWSGAFAIGAAVVGIAGGLLGFFSRQDKWLEYRLVTESLRQFHFRTIIQMSPDILAAATSGNDTDFKRKRSIALTAFQKDIVDRKGGVLQAIVDEPDPPFDGRIDPIPSPSAFAGPHGEVLLKAYRNLRILRQRQFADHKLSVGKGLFPAFPRAQAARLGAIALSLVALLFAMHVGSALLATLSTEGLNEWFHFGAIWIALLALALRAIEEGLRPRAEVERYRHYQATTRRILERFDTADIAGKLAAAQALEMAAFDEMAIFLRSNHEARFVI